MGIESGTNFAKNGFDTDVNINDGHRPTEEILAHEIGYTMGLPHLFPSKVNNGPIYMTPDQSKIIESISSKGNLMMPGPFRSSLKGTKITASQILHIATDFKNNKLNSNSIGGGDSQWVGGQYQSQ